MAGERRCGVNAQDGLPSLRFALPLGSEARWSDMLAVLIETDPAPICRLLRLDVHPEDVRVQREVTIDSANRPDLVLHVDDRRVAVLEVKVLAGLGRRQLARYADAEPGADAYVLIFPGRLIVDTKGDSLWRGTTWESVLGEYAKSTHSWVAACAEAWLSHLDETLPKIGPNTVWDDLRRGENFIIAMRARMSWVHVQIDPPAPIDHDLVGSSAGVSWVVRMFTEALVPGYRVIVEIEENLPVRNFPKFAGFDARFARGPSAKVCLMQYGVETSVAFNWGYLSAMWPLMRAARSDWVTRSASPKAAHDRAGHQAMIAEGAPAYLGVGFGDAQAKINGACMFGARIQFPPDVRLGDLAASLQDLSKLVLDMAHVEPPQR